MSAHAHHHHHVAPDADAKRLIIALSLLAGLMAGEVTAGVLASSLALLSDAAHLLMDVVALALSLLAMRLAKRPAKGALTFGLARSEILAAQFNGATLLVLGLFVVYEAIRRLVNPPQVGGTIVLVVALVGVAVNLVATRSMAGANRESMNVEGAYQHILTDLFGFGLTAIAGAVVLTTGFDRADGIASLFLAAILLNSAYGLLRASGRVFLEAAPEGMDPDEIGHALVAHEGVVEVHDLHVWEITSGFPALAAHVVVGEHDQCHSIRDELEELLHTRFAIQHTTLQVDHRNPGELLEIQAAPPRSTERSATM
jgi:cobalt-zinc-cadmium efflux system protein